MLPRLLLPVPPAPPQSLSVSPPSRAQGTAVIQRGDELQTKVDGEVLAQLILCKPTRCEDHTAPGRPWLSPLCRTRSTALRGAASPSDAGDAGPWADLSLKKKKPSTHLTHFIWRVNNLSQIGIFLRSCSAFSPCTLRGSGCSGTEGSQSIL